MNLVTFVAMCVLGAAFLSPRIQLLFHSVDLYLQQLRSEIHLRHRPFCPEVHYLQGFHSYQISGGRL